MMIRDNLLVQSMAAPAPLTSPTETIIRRILLATLLLSLIGTATELVLLEHYEDWRQRTPLVLLGCGLLVLLWHGIDRRAAPVRTLQGLMVAFAIAGVAGLVLHYRGNMEFELEMYPTTAGMELFRKTMTGATPALSPGTMLQISLVGLAYTFRHPRLARG
jgi:peptidoglycan/LPS O-acetylase OafA/YrhL